MKNLIIYDNGGETLDRYTIIKKDDFALNYKDYPSMFTGRYLYNCICASENGTGVFTWATAMRGKHLGKKVEFDSLNKELQQKIIIAYKE